MTREPERKLENSWSNPLYQQTLQTGKIQEGNYFRAPPYYKESEARFKMLLSCFITNTVPFIFKVEGKPILDMKCLRDVTVQFRDRLRLTCYYKQVALAQLFYVF